MEHFDGSVPAGADLRQVLTLCAETVRVLDEAPGPLRQLRLHCLRERTQLMLASLRSPFDESVPAGR